VLADQIHAPRRARDHRRLAAELRREAAGNLDLTLQQLATSLGLTKYRLVA
jgi:hypothetical protein